MKSKSPQKTRKKLKIGKHIVLPGEHKRVDLLVGKLPTNTSLHLPLTVIHGKEPGPKVWLSAGIHGDELNGVEIIRQVLEKLEGRSIKGTIIAAPIVNVFGFINQSRYLPDRRDLNRSFPGSKQGPLASRLAHLFMKEVVSKCTHGIDLHTGSLERENLPQIRTNIKNKEAFRLAKAFGAPVILNSKNRDGSLRESASKLGIPALLYEAGEPQRFNENAISIGVRGVLGMIKELRMIPPTKKKIKSKSLIVKEGKWVRAKKSGVLRLSVELGNVVKPNQRLGVITDPFGDAGVEILSPFHGLIIGRSNNPMVYMGDGILNIAKLSK
jgi:uncharacterized protein